MLSQLYTNMLNATNHSQTVVCNKNDR